MTKKTLKTNTLLFFILAGLIAVFWKYLNFSYLFLFEDIGSDTLSLFYPNLLEDVRVIRQEGIPYWSFSKGIGQSNYSENILSPFTWIYVLLGEQYLAYGIGWSQFLKVLIIGIVTYKLFEFQGVSKNASVLGCSLTTFLGYVIVGSSWYGHSTNIMFILMLLLGIEMYLRQLNWWLIPIAIFFLLGPSLVFTVEFVVIYMILRLSLSTDLNFPTLKRIVSNSWQVILTAILLVAPFLGSEIYKFIYSPRVGGQASYSDSLSSINIFSTNSMEHYATIISRFFSNDLIGTGDLFSGWGNYLEAPLFYCGVGTLLLVPQLFRFLTKHQKLAFASVLSLWLIILIFPYFRYAFYLFAGDYYKSALSLFVPFTLVWMAVLAFDQMIKGKKLSLLILTITGAILLTLLLSISYISPDVVLDSSNRNTILIFIVAEIACLYCFHFLKQKKLTLLLFTGLMILEGAVLSYPGLNNRQSISKESFSGRTYYNDYTLEALDYIRSIDQGFYRVEKTYGSFLSGQNDSQAQGFFDTKSYRSHNHNNYIQFFLSMNMMDPDNEYSTRWIEGLSIAPEIHPFFHVNYMITKPGSTNKLPNIYYESLGEINGLTIYKNKTPIPFGFPVNTYITESEFNGLDSYYKKLSTLYKSVVIPDDEISNYPALRRINPASIASALALSDYSTKYSETSFEMSIFTQSDIKGSIDIREVSMLVFTFPYDVGWRAYVNGSKADLSYVDNGMTGLYLQPGFSEIELKYRPPFLAIGIFFFCIGIGLFIFFILRNKSGEPLVKKIFLSEKSDIQKGNIDLKKENKTHPSNSKYKKKKGRK